MGLEFNVLFVNAATKSDAIISTQCHLDYNERSNSLSALLSVLSLPEIYSLALLFFK